jgi:benzoyl-CoA 2,3-epoxidase subunit A
MFKQKRSTAIFGDLVMDASDVAAVKQHLIDPEICIRCNTCEAICPVKAITHDSNNYVVDASICNGCMACISPCPTGSIDNWRVVPRLRAYSLEDQLGWEELPPESNFEDVPTDIGMELPMAASGQLDTKLDVSDSDISPAPVSNTQFGAQSPPWSAAHAYTNLFGPKAAEQTITATVAGNVRVTEVGREYDTHHVVLDFGSRAFPVLEGQSIGVVPPGLDANGKPHRPRQYSVASPRNGERAGYNNISLTIKRVLEDHEQKPVCGVASNFMCDLQVGDEVKVTGPFGSSFLMPNHPGSHIVMICTGTGSAPMRAMTEWRRRLVASGKFAGGKLMLFFGARTQEELPYFGPLHKLPEGFIDINFAFSRTVEQPKKYVQDVMRERAADIGALLADPNAYFYVCGLKSMEGGVLLALQDIALQTGLNWETVAADLKRNGRLHLETY